MVQCLFEDREHNLWVGTVNGLNRFFDGKITIQTIKEGLSQDVISAVWKDHKQTLWIGTSSAGLNRIINGSVTVYTNKNGLLDDNVHALYEDYKLAL